MRYMVRMASSRCPMCHMVNQGIDPWCVKCGYEFGQPIEKVRELLRDQLHGTKIALWVWIGLLVAAFALPGYMIYAHVGILLLPGLGLVGFLVTRVLRTLTRISNSRASLASLDRQQAELPKATALPPT